MNNTQDTTRNPDAVALQDSDSHGKNTIEKEILIGNGAISITPNPSTGIFTLDAGKQTPDTKQITIYNAYGERIYSASVIGHRSSVIDLSSHSKGIYFVKVQTAEKVFTEKIILQ